MSDQLTEPAVGSTVCGVRLDAELGRGGMGVVFRGHQLALNRTVALKMIQGGLAGSERFRARFRRECENAASLENPHVVPIYSVDEHHGHPIVVMRYIEGVDLARTIHGRGPLPLELAADVVRQIAEALDAAHRRALVHRDVKPANILVQSGPGRTHALLTDFGISQAAADSVPAGSSLTVGTVDYTAPEQYGPHVVDGRADIYALGCVLFEALTGSVPFPRPDPAARRLAHLHEQPPSPRRSHPRLPAALDGVLARAMAKNPADRFPTAGAFAEAVVGVARTATPTRTPAPSHTPAPARTPLPPGAPVVPGARRPEPGAAPKSPPPTARPSTHGSTPAPTTAAGAARGRDTTRERSASKEPVKVGWKDRLRRPGKKAVLLAAAALVLVVAVVVALVTLLPAGPARAVGDPIAVGKNPLDVEGGGGFVWTANAGDATISKIDPATGAVQSIPVDGRPAQVEVGGGGVWVRNFGDGVTRVDLATGAQTTVATGPAPISFITVGDDFLWASQPSINSVIRIDMTTSTVTGTFAVGAAPRSLAYVDHRLFAANRDDRTLTALDGQTGALVGSLSLPSVPGAIDVDGDTLYVSQGSSANPDDFGAASIQPVNATTLAPGRTFLPSAANYYFAVGDGVGWLSNPARNHIERLDLSTRPPGTDIVEDQGRNQGDMNVIGNQVWSTNIADNTVTRLDITG